MPPRPLISIVLPTYNGARYLHQAIDSCLAQTYQNWELIIVDDASTDDTPSLIANYTARDGRIRTIRNPTNRKLPGTLNNGFALARGELLTWTSDDNCYRPEALTEMLAFLEENPSVDVVYADFTVIDQQGSPLRGGGTGPLEDLPLGNCVGACFLYRRAVQERLGGYAEDLFLVEDYDFWLRASASFRLARLAKDLYLYRRHTNSLSNLQPLNVSLAHEKCLARNLPRMTWMDRQLRRRAYRHLVSMAMKRGDRSAARSHALKWVGSDPLLVLRGDLPAAARAILPGWLDRLRARREAIKWSSRLRGARKELCELLPRGVTLILVDENQLGGETSPAHPTLPFLEKEGQYWGPP